MTVAARTWRVGIVGMSPLGLFLLERLSLSSEIQISGIVDDSPRRRDLAVNIGCHLWDQPHSAVVSNDTDAVFLVEGISYDLISTSLLHRKHVVVQRPWLLSSRELRDLAEKAASSKCLATMACPRRGSSDFLAALTAKNTGRLGALHSIRLTSCEMALPPDASSAGVLREFGFHWLDQLLLLAESTPVRVFAKRFTTAGENREHGFLATIEFASGCTAQIELQTQSRLAHRTGWMLEGTIGSYRADRLYTVTPAGEIVDEPQARPVSVADPLIEELVSAWQGEFSKLPTLTDAAEVMKLVELIEQSAALGTVVQVS